MAVGNTLEALLGASLLLRIPDFRRRLDRVRDVAALVVLAAGLSTVVSATFGVASLRLGGVVPMSATWSTWRMWWVGDALGSLVVAPVLLAARSSRRVAGNWRRRLEAGAVVVGLVGVTDFALRSRFSYPYLIFPFVMWAAVRFAQRGAAGAALVVSIVAIGRTSEGVGSFAVGSTTNALWVLDTFLAVVAVSGLILAAIVTERDRVQNELRQSQQ